MTHTFTKTTLAAAAVVATSLIAFQPSEADAKIYIDLHLVAPGPSYYSPPPPRHAPPPPRQRVAPARHRLSCNQVRRVLRNNYGFYKIQAFDCKGKSYWFYASKNGKRFKVKAASTNGQVIRKHRI